MKITLFTIFCRVLAETASVKVNTSYVDSFVHPIAIDGKHFVDSVTNERFYIRGVDYQPGGAAAYNRASDPLSDPNICARDIYLMQQLGVNTVRVYTVNPHLSHDDCMTMLAAANMYLVLDVNSPLVSESINRYEPWTTYTSAYLNHVFQIVEQFSHYNNTLGFFIGNEIVNDERSANVSPRYIRAVTRDVKEYMYYNSPRYIPLGYSAADDLRYRTQLPDYLACGDKGSAVDFYGINSYQWCGAQTIKTSGYDTLIRDYQNFSFPIFFSEFGCNHVQPRLFQEVGAMFSPAMTPYFDGGLLYEYSQEVSDYGVVQLTSSGDAQMLEDFATLRSQYEKATSVLSPATEVPVYSNATNASMSFISNFKTLTDEVTHGPGTNSARSRKSNSACKEQYSNLAGATLALPDTFGTDMIRNGVQIHRGAYSADILYNMPSTTYKVFDVDGQQIIEPYIEVSNNFSANIVNTPWKRPNRPPLFQSSGIKDGGAHYGPSKLNDVRETSSKANNSGYRRTVAPNNWMLLFVVVLFLIL